ncbi:hypothetical protein HAX54_025523 [Datura stramonium]|uniref:Neprosin PEP catalytic domain-containing protein n=1 Tax=Datura stramonium TaxID=4076 RepID=A0ABS8RK66_DATST|nr:hypothetical protein [Datura stramonium]
MKYDRVRRIKLSEEEDFELEKQLKLLKKPAIRTIKKMMMNRRMIEHFLLMVFLCLSYDGVQGTKLSKQEDLELEKQLKIRNKSAIKTIKTKYGDIYDCVNFYNQPAFDHPLLKNHNYHPQMKPSLSMKESASTVTSNKLSIIRCPIGTVPIRRITKEDLIRHKLMPPPEDVMIDSSLTRGENSIGSKRRRYKPLQGYKAFILKTIQVTNLEEPDGKTSDCFNLLCPGFVLLSTEVPIDGVIDPVSERGGNISEIGLSINWDLKEGNWWLYYTKTNTAIGFWPREVFDEDFAYFVTRVEWGGVTYSPPGILEPPMGSGFFPIKNNNYDAFCKNITLLNDKGEPLYHEAHQFPIYLDSPKLYNVIDTPGIMFYGGPGDQYS